MSIVFLSTLSLRRATRHARASSNVFEFLSTLSLRRATFPYQERNTPHRISIHALLAESDVCARLYITLSRNFYPRSPCGERHCRRAAYPIGKGFLSTLSLRRATSQALRVQRAQWISIHALLAESDVVDTVKFASSMLFLSTLSLRRATDKSSAVFNDLGISIHALLAESDASYLVAVVLRLGISIHALLAESDPSLAMRMVLILLFLSTLSLRRATQNWQKPHGRKSFLSTLSLRRATTLI